MTSRDHSNASSGRTASEDDLDSLSPDNGLRLQLAPFRLEHLEDYEVGGHHPVHLGVTLGDNGRYTVIHKLGHGGFANVWLCRDTLEHSSTSYVAVKILMAEVSNKDCSELHAMQLKKSSASKSNFLCLPLDKFDINGPNGLHYCFVYPVLGPRASDGLYRGLEDRDQVLREICLRVTQAIASLHDQGLCHGDLTPSNILHRISGLDGLSEVAILDILGQPTLNTVYHIDSGGKHNNPSAPEYLVYPIDWHAISSSTSSLRYISSDTCLIDFGESFTVSDPPEQLGIPGPYRSPELILESKAGYGSDLWALGCTLFEIRTGRKLFNLFDDEDDGYLEAMVQLLGVMPEPWWSATWTDRPNLYKDGVDETGRAVSKFTSEAQHGLADGPKSVVHPSVAEGARSLLDKLAPGVWYLSDDMHQNEEHRDISLEERELFADLLGKMLAYQPEARISAKDALEHAWIKLGSTSS